MRRSECRHQHRSLPELLLIAILILSATALFAQESGAPEEDTAQSDDPTAGPWLDTVGPAPAERALEEYLGDVAGVPLGNLTVGEFSAALDLISVARQEHDHIERSARLSWVMPGLGHYINGQTGVAIAYAATDVLVLGLTAWLTYALLPPAVQSRNLNYLQSSWLDIQTRWEGVSAYELIPSVAMAVSGTLLSVTIRGISARNARVLADESIESGLITFPALPAGGLAR